MDWFFDITSGCLFDIFFFSIELFFDQFVPVE